ncbi:MAG: phage tail protein [Cellvibrionaceae bacterium]
MSTQAITNAGRALLASKQAAGQSLDIDRFMLANIDGLDHTQAVNLDEPLPSVGDQVDTLAVTKAGYIGPDEVVYSLYLPSTAGDFTYNWIGLLADDDTLIAAAYLLPVNKVASAGGSVGNTLNENIMLAYTNAQAITNLSVDASTWQWQFDETTEDAKGLAEVATQAEVNTGTDDARIVTPKKLAAWFASVLSNASTTVKGIVELATTAETQAGTDSSRAVTPAGLKATTATESRRGVAEVATQAEVNTGTDDTRMVTPKKLAAWLAAALSNASTTVKGIVELATTAETQAGTDSGRAVTPAGLKGTTATESRRGVAEIATQAEVNTGTDDTRMVTPKKLRSGVSYFASSTGFVALPVWLGSFKLQWGAVTISSSGSTITFPSGFSSACWAVFGQTRYTTLKDANWYVGTPSKTNFFMKCPNTSMSMFWWAIGK